MKDFFTKFMLGVIGVLILLVLIRAFFWMVAIAVLITGIIWIVIKIARA